MLTETYIVTEIMGVS